MKEETKTKIANSLKGRRHTEKAIKNMKLAGKPNARRENNKYWKGDSATYVSIHCWVTYWKGKPTTCEMCGRENLTGHSIQWANKDHKYKRVLNDYIRLCAKCHDLYDVENGFKDHTKKNSGQFKKKEIMDGKN